MIDIAIVIAYFGLIVFFGLKMGKKEDSLEEFALANRKIPWWAVLASIIAAETSAGSFLGTPGEGFVLKNYHYLQMGIGTVLGRLLVARLFIKVYYDLNVTSIYEFLEVRFGKFTRDLASLLFLITRSLASGTRLYIAAILLTVLYRISYGVALTAEQEIFVYAGAILVMTLLTAIYTTLGGIKAVIWTDLIQAALMFTGCFVSIGMIWSKIPGGFEGLELAIGPLSDISWLQWAPSPGKSIWTESYTFWSGVIGSTFITLATHGTDQDMVQRMLTAPDVAKSRRSLILSGLVDLPIIFGFLTVGILLAGYFYHFPDPMMPTKSGEIFAYFILTQLPTGIRGLVIAGIFATAMGSLSTALNALATSFTKDGWFKNSKRVGLLKTARRATVGFSFILALIGIATATFVVYWPTARVIPIALGVFGYTYGALLGVFLLGVLTTKRGSNLGNGIATAVSIASVFLLSHFYELAFPWRVMVGTIICVSVGIAFRPEMPGRVNQRASR